MSRVRQWAQVLLHLQDTPHRIALAFAIGVWIGFFPILGIHTGMALGVAFAFRLSRAAVLIGAWGPVNPWTLAPIYTAGTFFGCFLLGVSPAGLQDVDWGSLKEGSVLEGVRRLFTVMRPFLLPYCVGNIVLGTVAAAIAYFPLRSYLERRRARSMPPAV